MSNKDPQSHKNMAAKKYTNTMRNLSSITNRSRNVMNRLTEPVQSASQSIMVPPEVRVNRRNPHDERHPYEPSANIIARQMALIESKKKNKTGGKRKTRKSRKNRRMTKRRR